LAMVIPSRWMAGSRGRGGSLLTFRDAMLSDKRLRTLVDHPIASDIFPGVQIEGGVCYFLWERESDGPCQMTIIRGDQKYGPQLRRLDEFDVLVRDGRAVNILRKVLAKDESFLAELVSGDTPFGIPTNFTGYRKGERKPGDLKLYLKEGSRSEKWIDPEVVKKNTKLIRNWKVFVPESRGSGGSFPELVLGHPFVGGPGTVSTQTFLCIGPLDSKAEAESVMSYLQTRFFRFLVSLRKISQHAPKSVYTWVPQQKWDRTWTDAELYKKYGITKDEQAYIEAMIKEMAA